MKQIDNKFEESDLQASTNLLSEQLAKLQETITHLAQKGNEEKILDMADQINAIALEYTPQEFNYETYVTLSEQEHNHRKIIEIAEEKYNFTNLDELRKHGRKYIGADSQQGLTLYVDNTGIVSRNPESARHPKRK